jgi:hypothetical protein
MKCQMGDNILSIDNVCHVPESSESIYSLFLYIQHPGHGLKSSFKDGLFILFPNFQLELLLIYIWMQFLFSLL